MGRALALLPAARAGVFVVLAGGGLASEGCMPHARPVDPSSGEVGETKLDGTHSHDENQSAVLPPPSALQESPRVTPKHEFTLMSGPRVCSSERPDLGAMFWSIELTSSLPPEDLLLLQAWVRASLSRELGQTTVRWFPRACEASFLCFSASPKDGPDVGAAVGKVLPSPSTDLFYSVRSAVAKIAEEWDRNSADWKLHTATRALTRDSIGRAQLDAAKTATNSDFVGLIKREAGAARVSRLEPQALQTAWAAAMTSGRVVLSSPSHLERSLENLKAAFPPKQPAFAPKKAAPASANKPHPAPLSPTLMEEHRGDWTQAALVWELEDAQVREPVNASLTVVVSRFREQTSSSVRARVDAHRGLYSMPALRLEGPYEEVLRALSELSTELDRLVSAYGTPSRQERAKALGYETKVPHFEERCLSGRADTSALEAGRNALRKAGPPVVVVWGSATPPLPSE